MSPIEVSIIAGIIFIIISFGIDIFMNSTVGYSYCDLSKSMQYTITFLTAFSFSMLIEYTELNDYVCSGNH